MRDGRACSVAAQRCAVYNAQQALMRDRRACSVDGATVHLAVSLPFNCGLRLCCIVAPITLMCVQCGHVAFCVTSAVVCNVHDSTTAHTALDELLNRCSKEWVVVAPSHAFVACRVRWQGAAAPAATDDGFEAVSGCCEDVGDAPAP